VYDFVLDHFLNFAPYAKLERDGWALCGCSFLVTTGGPHVQWELESHNCIRVHVSWGTTGESVSVESALLCGQLWSFAYDYVSIAQL
jgi:hypothetical protein